MTLAFLDIETSWQRTITIIGIYRPGSGTTQLVAPNIRSAARFKRASGAGLRQKPAGADQHRRHET